MLEDWDKRKKIIIVANRKKHWPQINDLIEEGLLKCPVEKTLIAVQLEEPTRLQAQTLNVTVKTRQVDMETAMIICQRIAVVFPVRLYNDLLPQPHKPILVEQLVGLDDVEAAVDERDQRLLSPDMPSADEV